MIEHWMSLKQMAAHLQVETDELTHWVEHKGLPARRTTYGWRFNRHEVEAWIDRVLDEAIARVEASRSCPAPG